MSRNSLNHPLPIQIRFHFLAMKRFLLCAALSTFCFLDPAHSAVVYSGQMNITIPLNFTGIYLNVFTGATSTAQPVDWNTAPWMNPFFGGVDLSSDDLLRLQITGTDQVINLPYSSVVDSTGNYPAGESGSSTHFGPAANQFQASTPGYIGFAFETTVGGPTYYGWAKITVNNSSPGTVHEWAYENVAGTGINVGAIPEPGTTALAVLSVGLVFARRRRARD